MRLIALLSLALVFAAPASAAAPRFGLFDLNALARASHNIYGDVKVSQRMTALRGTVVHCGTGCRFGSGWLAFAQGPGLAAGDGQAASPAGRAGAGWPAFAKGPSLAAGDVKSARAHSGRIGWSVDLGLTARGRSRW